MRRRCTHHSAAGLGELRAPSHEKTTGMHVVVVVADLIFAHQQVMVHRRIPLIREYTPDPPQSETVDRIQFREYLRTATHSNSGEPRICFNAVVAKLLQLVRYVEEDGEQTERRHSVIGDRPSLVSIHPQTGRFNSCKF